MRVSDVCDFPPDPRSVVPGLGLSSTLYGIEIEIENVLTRPDLKWWAWANDGSLRNNGVELILRAPIGGKDLEAAMAEFSLTMEALGQVQDSPPEITERCSVHTHIDFRGSSITQALSFFIGFCLFEAALFTMGGKDRYSSIYCPGISSCRPLVRLFNKLYTADSPSKIKRVLDAWTKYTAVNLGSIRHHGSIEVRSHKGTASAADIILWVKVLDTLKVFTDNYAPEDIVGRCASEGLGFASTVFGPLSSHILTDNYVLYRENNLRNAMDCLFLDKLEALNRPAASTDAQAIAQAIIDFFES